MWSFFTGFSSKKEVVLDMEMIDKRIKEMLKPQEKNLFFYVTTQWKAFFENLPEEHKEFAPDYAKALIEEMIKVIANENKKFPLLTALYRSITSLHQEEKINNKMTKSLLAVFNEYHDLEQKKQKPVVVMTVRARL